MHFSVGSLTIAGPGREGMSLEMIVLLLMWLSRACGPLATVPLSHRMYLRGDTDAPGSHVSICRILETRDARVG